MRLISDSLCALLLFPGLFFSGFRRGNAPFSVKPLVLYLAPYLVFLVFVAVVAPWIGRVIGMSSGGYFQHLLIR